MSPNVRPTKFYCVIGQEYGTVVPILDYGEGPTEYGCDVVYVEASNKREARVKAIKMPGLAGHVDIQRSDGCSPFTGLRVEEVTEEEFREEEERERLVEEGKKKFLQRWLGHSRVSAAPASTSPSAKTSKTDPMSTPLNRAPAVAKLSEILHIDANMQPVGAEKDRLKKLAAMAEALEARDQAPATHDAGTEARLFRGAGKAVK